MRVVVALGGNALLRRGEPMTAEVQRCNVRAACQALLPLTETHDLVISHGNGPQVGLLALQAVAYDAQGGYPLDVLDAETEGQIGYLIEQELGNLLPPERRCATLLTQIEVDARDPAFNHPTKPIGPGYEPADARRIAQQRGWSVAPDGVKYRRVVPAPSPQRICELSVIELLISAGVIVICAGGGGIPVVRGEDGCLFGVEAVIDKDLASALLARSVGAQALLMLTDVSAVEHDWGRPTARQIRSTTAQALKKWSFAAGSMGPKVQAACEFVEATGGVAGIGRMQDARAILNGEAGTLISTTGETRWW